jgi:hypothetical protein
MQTGFLADPDGRIGRSLEDEKNIPVLPLPNAQTSRSPIALSLRNTCSMEVRAAVYYLDSKWSWQLGKWFAVSPNTAVILNGVTINDIFYVYAESEDNQYSWSGDTKIMVDGTPLGFKEVTIHQAVHLYFHVRTVIYQKQRSSPHRSAVPVVWAVD